MSVHQRCILLRMQVLYLHRQIRFIVCTYAVVVIDISAFMTAEFYSVLQVNVNV